MDVLKSAAGGAILGVAIDSINHVLTKHFGSGNQKRSTMALVLTLCSPATLLYGVLFLQSPADWSLAMAWGCIVAAVVAICSYLVVRVGLSPAVTVATTTVLFVVLATVLLVEVDSFV